MLSSTCRQQSLKFVRLASSKVPAPQEINKKNAVYDQVTHTGQAWDQADYRLSRFEISKKQVNPNIAMHLVAEKTPKACEERVIWCDGGHPATGHPKVISPEHMRAVIVETAFITLILLSLRTLINAILWFRDSYAGVK